MHLFRDIRGFTMLAIISAVSGTVYLATAIIWPSQVAVIYSTSITDPKKKAWASTTIAFGIWGGLILLSPLIGLGKFIRIQLILQMAVSVAFLGALVSCNPDNFGQSAAFSFLVHTSVAQLCLYNSLTFLSRLRFRLVSSRSPLACLSSLTPSMPIWEHASRSSSWRGLLRDQSLRRSSWRYSRTRPLGSLRSVSHLRH